MAIDWQSKSEFIDYSSLLEMRNNIESIYSASECNSVYSSYL